MDKIVKDIFYCTPRILWVAFITLVINKAGRMYIEGFIQPEIGKNILILLLCFLGTIVLHIFMWLLYEI